MGSSPILGTNARLLPKPTAKERELIVFSASDVKAILVETKERREGLRDRALITLLLDTGIRIGEATSLTPRGVDWQEGLLSVDGKTDHRQVPFGPKAKRALKAYIDRERVARRPRVQQVFLTQEGDPVSSKTLTRCVLKIATAAEVGATKRGPQTSRPSL